MDRLSAIRDLHQRLKRKRGPYKARPRKERIPLTEEEVKARWEKNKARCLAYYYKKRSMGQCAKCHKKSVEVSYSVDGRLLKRGPMWACVDHLENSTLKKEMQDALRIHEAPITTRPILPHGDKPSASIAG